VAPEEPRSELPVLQVDRVMPARNASMGRRGSLKPSGMIPVVNALPDSNAHDNTEVPLAPSGDDQRRFSLQAIVNGRVQSAIHDFYEVIFAFYDKAGTGKITREQVIDALEGFNHSNEAEVKKVVAELKTIDYDGNGDVDKEEFVVYLTSLGDICESISEWRLMEVKVRKNLGMPAEPKRHSRKSGKKLRAHNSKEAMSPPSITEAKVADGDAQEGKSAPVATDLVTNTLAAATLEAEVMRASMSTENLHPQQ
jgi:hypothetical protein